MSVILICKNCKKTIDSKPVFVNPVGYHWIPVRVQVEDGRYLKCSW